LWFSHRKEHVLADIYVPEDPQSKPFAVLSFSRQTLTSLGFTYDQVASLTDAEMDTLAERLQAQYLTVFYEKVRFFVSVYLAERNWHNVPA
jgi:hypothetical protein